MASEESKVLDLLDRYAPEAFHLPDLKPGMVVAVAMDAGPSGPCGQCMSITCPWQHLHIFPGEDSYRSFREKRPLGRKGSRYIEAYAVVGDHGTGHMFITNHCVEEPTNAN